MNTPIKYDGDPDATLADGRKPIYHEIIVKDTIPNLDRNKLMQFYADAFFFKQESSRFDFRGKYSIEPRFALGQTRHVRELAKIAAFKMKKHSIRQIVAPGVGGVCALACFIATGERFNWATLRIDGEKRKRLLTALEGHLERDTPVWITDDLIASGNAFIKTIRLLRELKFTIAGFIPVVADLTGNVGCRGLETLSQCNRFKFDYLLGVRRLDKSRMQTIPVNRKNSVIYE